MLHLRLLGDIEVLRDGRRIALPPSRKTRALLAYLAATGKPHRRERLCAMFWDVPDDPRGALRWSLSRLRALIDEPDRPRIAATRETVAFEPAGAVVDLLDVRKRVAAGFPAIPLADLEALAADFRGEFLEGIDLPDLPDFQAWCLAEREDLRRLQVRVLSVLIGRLAEQPEAALAHARELVKIDPFSEAARASLLQLLRSLGRHTEAERHFESAVRVFRELGGDAELGLQTTWRKLQQAPPQTVARAADAPQPAPAAPTASPRTNGRDTRSLVGRESEWGRLSALLDQTRAGGESRVALVAGEPGLGKTRLLAELIRQARQRGIATFVGQSLETDRGRPFGPWIEALGTLPELSAPDGVDPAMQRERLFGAIAARVLGAPALLVFDDAQWCDEASADLLQHVVRAGRDRPLLAVLAARGGELPDNPPVQAMLRGLRHAERLQEIRLSALSPRDIVALVSGAFPDADADLISAHCGGNPLFALEMARRNAGSAQDVIGSLKRLVRDRIERLPGHAAEALTWASILGPVFRLDHLTRVVPLRPDELTGALEIAERHELLGEATSDASRGSYRFTHDLVHAAVYTSLSEPRRRLMHLKTARALQEMGPGDEAIASVIAHHAALGGEPGMAAAGCVAAGRRCLRLFANAGAEALARKGLRYADGLPEPQRSQRMLELIQIEILARRPADLEQAIGRVEALAERALDLGCVEHARIGFHMLSHLRWEGGSWADAQRDTLRAEFVSRSADEKQRVHAMAEAARCLAMLERDLGQAEALALEARAVAQRLGVGPNAIFDAIGLLRLHQGALEEAAELFQHARDAARREGERAEEFFALEHLVGLEIQCRRYRKAAGYCDELVALSGKLRDGSEAPCAHALRAICRLAQDEPGAADEFARAAAALRAADAKYRLGFALICAAEIDIDRARLDQARDKAAEALALVTVLGRASEIAAAHSLLARVAGANGDRAGLDRHVGALRESLVSASCWAQTFAEAALELVDEKPARSRAPGVRRYVKARS